MRGLGSSGQRAHTENNHQKINNPLKITSRCYSRNRVRAGSGRNLLASWRCVPGLVAWYYAACDVSDREGVVPVTTVGRWTGREATLLREALRLSVRDFADYLGVGMRTINKWEARQADITQRPHMQEVLDTALSRASDEVKARFSVSAHAEVPEHETARLSRGGHAAWLFHDLGDRHSAARYYSLAEVATQKAGDLALDAYVRGFRSLVMGSEGQAREALAFACGAVEMAQRCATATMRAWLAGVEAQAWASVGDETACCGALRRAEIAIGQARREDDPPWMYEFDRTRLLALAGGCYARVGKIAVAERTLREALEALDPQHRRRRAEVLIDLASVRAQPA